VSSLRVTPRAAGVSLVYETASPAPVSTSASGAYSSVSLGMPNPVTRASFDLRVEHGPVYRVYFIERGEVVIDLLLPTVGGNWHAV